MYLNTHILYEQINLSALSKIWAADCPLESLAIFGSALLCTQVFFAITDLGIFCGNQQHEAVDSWTCLNPKHCFNHAKI